MANIAGLDTEKQSLPGKSPFHYSWIIMLVTFLTLLIAAGIRSTSGVLIMPLEEYFGWNRTVITFALAINLVLYGLCGPFSAALVNYTGSGRPCFQLWHCWLLVPIYPHG